MLVRSTLGAALFLTVSGSALAQSHAMIDSTRSSLNKNVFFKTSVEGEYGRMQRTAKEGGKIDFASWRGYGIHNGLGMELYKFTQVSLSHTLLNLRSQNSGMENLNGSRIAAEVAFSFSSPIANLTFGLGVLGTQLQYQSLAKSSTYAGTGRYYSVGMNHFINSSVSVQLTGKRLESENRLAGGSSEFSQLNAKTDNFSLGIAIWL